MNIILYTKTGCPWCADVLQLLQEKKIPFEEREVRGNTIYFDELVKKSGQTKTPTLDIDGFILADSDKEAVYEYLKKKGVLDSDTITTKATLLASKEFIEKYKSTQNAVLLDVRTSSEFNDGHIPNAINIDISNPDFEKNIRKLDNSKTYFLYCHSGARSAIAISIMKKNNIFNLYDLKGGIISN